MRWSSRGASLGGRGVLAGDRDFFVGWLGIGLCLRLLLMPFAFSGDLLAIYWRSHLIAHEGVLYGSYAVNMGAQLLHAVSLLLLAPLLPPPEVLWPDTLEFVTSGDLGLQVQDAFLHSSGVPQTLFALKLPYLLADLLAGVLLLRLLGTSARAGGRWGAGVRRAWVYWMLSPVGLYAGYIFARYEAFPVVLVLAALLACERRRPWLGAVLLGLAVTVRTYPVLLIPVFALLAVRTLPRQLLWAGVACLPLTLVMAANRIVAGTVGEVARLRDFDSGSKLFAFTVPVGEGTQLYVFVVFAVAVYGVLFGLTRGWWGSQAVTVERLWLWLLVFHAGMFALGTFSAHYFMWFTPFVALAFGRRPQWQAVLPLHLAQCIVVFAMADLVVGPTALLGAFRAAAPTFGEGWPNLQEAFVGAPPDLAGQVLGLLLSAFLVITALLAWPAVGELRATEPGQTQAGGGGHQQQPDDGQRRTFQQPPAGLTRQA